MKDQSKTDKRLVPPHKKVPKQKQTEPKDPQIEKAGRENIALRDILLANLPAGIVIIDPVTRIIESVNKAAADMFGVQDEYILGHKCHEFLCPETDGACPVCDRGLIIENAEREMVCVDGSRLPILKSVKRVPISGREKLLECFLDIHTLKLAEKKLKESESRLRAISDSAQDAILMMDPKGRISYWNPAATTIFGYTETEAVGQDLHRLIAPPRYHEAHYAAFPLFQREGRGTAVGETLDLEAMRKDGKEIAVQLSLSSVHMEGAWHAVGIIRDVTERKEAEEKIRQMAYYDALTGLPNRTLFSDRLNTALARARRDKTMVGVAMLDLDKFKDVNDTLGHDLGDLLLKATAQRLSAALRKSDTVARFGGDEFVLILPDLSEVATATAVVQRIIDGFREPFVVDTHTLAVTTSIGVAIYPVDGTDKNLLLKNADIAMYKAKQAGRNRYRFFTS